MIVLHSNEVGRLMQTPARECKPAAAPNRAFDAFWEGVRKCGNHRASLLFRRVLNHFRRARQREDRRWSGRETGSPVDGVRQGIVATDPAELQQQPPAEADDDHVETEGADELTSNENRTQSDGSPAAGRDAMRKSNANSGSTPGSAGGSNEGNVGNALRSVFQRTVDESVPEEMLDLLRKLK